MTTTPKTEEKIYEDITPENAKEILLYLLSSDSQEVYGLPRSTHPTWIHGHLYRPYELSHGGNPHDSGNPRHFHCEFEHLYEKTYNRSHIWGAMDSILEQIDELHVSDRLGRFGLLEVFYSLHNIDSRDYHNHSIPHKLRIFAETEHFKGRPALLWEPSNKGYETPVRDLHPFVYRAFVRQQDGLSEQYWMGRIKGESDPILAQLAFRGLAYFDPDIAEIRLPELTHIIEPSDAHIHIRSARRNL